MSRAVLQFHSFEIRQLEGLKHAYNQSIPFDRAFSFVMVLANMVSVYS